MQVKRSYPALSFISGLYKFLVVIAAIIGLLIAFNGRGLSTIIFS
jgi:small-conductance mechanosensitive channel